MITRKRQKVPKLSHSLLESSTDSIENRKTQHEIINSKKKRKVFKFYFNKDFG